MDEAAGVWIAVGSELGDGVGNVGDGVGARVAVSVGVADAGEPEGDEAPAVGCGDPTASHATRALSARTTTAPATQVRTKAR